MKIVVISGTGLIGSKTVAIARAVTRSWPPRPEAVSTPSPARGSRRTLTPGQSFYEGPGDVHVVDRNASATQPAKFLVVLIKDKGAPAVVPAQ